MKRYSKTMSVLIAFIIIITIFLSYDLTLSYANDNTNIIEIDIYGDRSSDAPMFSEGLWAPGIEQSGVMRLNNDYSHRVKIHNLGLTMVLEDADGTIIEPGDSEGLYQKYAESMKLVIKRGKLLVFKDTIYNGNFYDMIYEDSHDNFNGYSIPSSDQFNIDKNESIDLEYIVKMDESAGNELQGLKATVTFMVNVTENPISNPNDKDKREDIETIDEVLPQSGILDINGHWAEECILKLINTGIIKGYPDGTIRPDNTISRAETAVLISRALKLEGIDKQSSDYMDSIPDWAGDSINATTEEGIFEGYPIPGGKVFRVNQQITREEMATVLMRGFNLDLQQDIIVEFIDKDEISDWAYNYVEIGIENNIITGYPDKTFKPQNNITRAEAFTMICKLLKVTSN